MSEETEHCYQRILAKTNFEATQVSATIHKYLDPLSAIPSLDERTKFKTAVIQAKAQEGLSQEKILATFDGLKVALQNEQESFAASAEATKQREIDRSPEESAGSDRRDRAKAERDCAAPAAARRTSRPNWWGRRARFSAPSRSSRSRPSGAPLRSIRRRPSTSAFSRDEETHEHNTIHSDESWR